MNPFANSYIAITGPTIRLLSIVKELEEKPSTDVTAEELIRDGILAKYPGIEQVSDELEKSRKSIIRKLHEEAVSKVKP